MKARRILWVAVAVVLWTGSGVRAGISGNAYSEAFWSRNLVDSDSEVLSDVPDWQTGITTASYKGGIGRSKSSANLSAHGLGASGAAAGLGLKHVSPFGTVTYQQTGGHGVGYVQYTDTLTVTSDTLPLGTPVSVQFCWAVASSVHANHKDSYGQSPDNYAYASGALTFNVSAPSPYAGFNTYDTGVTNPLGTTLNGVWDTGTADRTIDVAVGSVLTLNVALSTSASASATGRYNPNTGMVEPDNGNSEFCGAVVFGAAALTPGVTLQSTYLKGEFPGLGKCTPQDAALLIPRLDLPEPATGLFLMLGYAPLALRRRRIPCS